MSSYLTRLESDQKESNELNATIKQRIERRELNGLLAEVEQLLRLRPDKSDVLELKKQLQEREATLRQTRDEAFAAALLLAESHDYEAALRELARIDDYVIDEPQQQLGEILRAKLSKLQKLQEFIDGRVTSEDFAGLLDLVKQFLELRPRDQAMLALCEELEARDAKNQAAVQAVVDNASALRRQGDFVGAFGLLAKIPFELETIASQRLLEECREMADLRRKATECLQRGMANSQFQTALTGAGVYRERIAKAEISDAEFEQLLQRCQTGLEEYERNEAQRKKFNQQVNVGFVAAAIFLSVGVVFYLVISASMRASSVKRALAAGDYEEVLRLDASNSEAWALKSKAETEAKEVAVSRALAAADYAEVLRLDASKLPAEAIPNLPAEAISKIPPIKHSIGLELKLLPAGEFTMGDSNGEGDETPHQVTLVRPFYLGVYEVTQEQYQKVMGHNPSNFRYLGAQNPVENVSWEDAVEFCKRLSALPEEKAAGRVYRLPTEAEWEYACRAGSKAEYCFGDSESELDEYGWFGKNSGDETHPVGKKKSNAWGLYDMHGNVWEWCSDWYADYPKGAVTDPVGPAHGSYRVDRGGSWNGRAAHCRSANRYWLFPSLRNSSVGFRVALSSPGIPK